MCQCTQFGTLRDSRQCSRTDRASDSSRLCLGYASTIPHLPLDYALASISCEHCRSSRNHPHCVPRHIIYYCVLTRTEIKSLKIFKNSKSNLIFRFFFLILMVKKLIFSFWVLVKYTSRHTNRIIFSKNDFFLFSGSQNMKIWWNSVMPNFE